MSTDTIESDNSRKSAPETEKPVKGRTRKPKATNKARGTKKPTAKPKAGRANKKAEVIALMQRTKGATLAEIMNETGWQAHTVRGFVSILGSKGGQKIESSRSESGERTYRIAK
jgi:Protein of unknown function (DUF3489)